MSLPGDDTSYDEMAASLLADLADALLAKRDWPMLHRLRTALSPDVATLKDPLAAPDPDMIKEAMERGLPGYHAAPEIRGTTTTMGEIRETLKRIYEDTIREQLSSADQMYRMLDKPLPAEAPKEYITWTDSGSVDSATLTSGGTWNYSVKRQGGKSGPKGPSKT